MTSDDLADLRRDLWQMTDGNLETLMGAGFSQAEAEAALKHTYNDVGRALHNLQVGPRRYA